MGVKREREEPVMPPPTLPAMTLANNLKEIWEETQEDPSAALCLMSTEFEEDSVTADFFETVQPFVDRLDAASTEVTLFNSVKAMPDAVVLAEIAEHADAGEIDAEEVAELAALTPAERKRELFVLKLEAAEAELHGEEGEEGEEGDDIYSDAGSIDDIDDSEGEGEGEGEGGADGEGEEAVRQDDNDDI